MIVISRCESEAIVIGDHVRVTVLEVFEDHVRFAIETGDDLTFYREQTVYLAGPHEQSVSLQPV